MDAAIRHFVQKNFADRFHGSGVPLWIGIMFDVGSEISLQLAQDGIHIPSFVGHVAFDLFFGEVEA